MNIHWTKLAQRDLQIINAYIERENNTAARKVVNRIYNATHTQLVTAPKSGRLGRIANSRELVITDIPYIIAYREQGGDLYILRVLHTSRQWPETL